MPLEHTVYKGGKALRKGITTGSCAALAAKAATRMLLEQKAVTVDTIITPAGIPVTAAVEGAAFTADSARCGVRKDAGDDVDVTHGLVICAQVSRRESPGIGIAGGDGVGRVTQPGLDQPVGEAAINRGPREMIARAVAEVCGAWNYTGGLLVTVSVPGGEDIAAKTFNPRLGIERGISILGTTGIVEPMSLQALVDTIHVEMKMVAATGETRLILTPGNYAQAFLNACHKNPGIPTVKCSNFIGESLDFAGALGFREVVLVGHLGKLSKVAAGTMNTHSRHADGRMEAIAAHSVLAGAGRDTVRQIMEAATTDQCVEILEAACLRRPVMSSLLEKILYHTKQRAGEGVRVEAVLFSNDHGPLAFSPTAGQYFGLEDL